MSVTDPDGRFGHASPDVTVVSLKVRHCIVYKLENVAIKLKAEGSGLRPGRELDELLRQGML